MISGKDTRVWLILTVSKKPDSHQVAA